MLDKLLEDLKKKLPGAKKSEELDGQEDQESTDEESDESADGAEDKKADAKKKSSPLIKIVIILAVGYLAFDYLMPTEDTTNIDQLANVPVPKRKKPKKNREQEANQAEQAKETKAEEPAKTDTATADASEPSSEKTDDELSKAISELPTDIKTETEVKPDTVTETKVEPKAEEVKTDLTTAPVEEINVMKNNDQVMSGLGEGSNQELKVETEAPTLASKISEPTVYVEPPKYDVLGRGLVYNCKGKHWACVDKANYQICHKNMKYNSENGKPSECVTQNVYANEEDCGTVQRYNVSTNVSTSFCK